jgi:RimJ/RimL family protein N-acetyltransferase
VRLLTSALMEFPPVSDLDELVRFLTGEEWPFHSNPRPDPSQIRLGDNTFWIVEGGVRLGLVRLLDLEDIADGGTPLFDLRVTATARGRGVGEAAVRWLTEHIFTNYDTNRIEGTTREDNHAMRRVFDKTGYVQEARYREAWPGQDRRYDSVGYAILRREWVSGR